MKKLLILLISLLPILTNAQDKRSVVTLKNGTVLKGVIRSIVPTEEIVLEIAGVESKIKMSDVATVEEEMSQALPHTYLSPNEKLIVTDNANYLETFDLEVKNMRIKMILIRGGEMNMGFDGKDSQDMNSEPVHRVRVTSFYISKECVPTSLASQLTDRKMSLDRPFFIAKWKYVEEMADTIAKITGIPVRIPTEAEWEFTACSEKQNDIFSYNDDDEFCSDYFAEYVNETIVDPTGPQKGRRHVVRYYGKGNRKFDRDHSDSENRMRLAIKAKDALNYVK